MPLHARRSGRECSAGGQGSSLALARSSSISAQSGGDRCHPRGCESRGCHCTLAALGESAVRWAGVVARACTLGIDLRPKRRRSMPPAPSGGDRCHPRSCESSGVPLHARGSERECSAGGQGSSLALARSASISAQSGGDRCHPRGCESSGWHCTLAALGESAVRRGRGRRSRLHARHRSPPKAAALDATPRETGCHCTLAALGESAVQPARALARACTLVIDLRPERRRSMPPAQL